jgi:hypothetical protein
MKKSFVIIFLFANSIIHGQSGIAPYLNEVKIDSLHSYIYSLSSSKMEGREVGKKGGKIAAGYIASIFRILEMDSLRFNGYYQKFDILKLNTGETIVKNQYKSDTLQGESMQAQNVIAFIKGYQNTKETIIISAHYDHLGKINDSTFYFGADDNASGVATMIEIARILQIAAKNGAKPKRNIMFVAFDGEEKRFLGSSYFLNNIPETINSIILNINLDMLGRERHDENKYNKSVFMISGGKNNCFYKRLIRQQNKPSESLFVAKYPLPFSSIGLKSFSDHFIFAKKGIPFIHFQTGMHNDNHTIKDAPDKINYEKLTEISKLICKSIWEIANTNKKLNVKIKK